MKCIIVFLTVNVLFMVASFSQETIHNTLIIDETLAVERALQAHLGIKISEIDVNLLEKEQSSRWNNFFPSIILGSNLLRSGRGFLGERANAESGNWNLNASLSASWNLSSAHISKALQTVRDYEKGLITHNTVVKSLIRDVKKSFYEVILLEEELKTNNAILQNTEKRYNTDQQNYRRGLVSEMVLLRSQLAYENAKLDINAKEVMYTIAVGYLKTLLVLGPEYSLKLAGSLDLEPLIFDADFLIKKYLYNRTDVQSALHTLRELEIAQQELYISSYTPTLSVAYSIGYTDLFSTYKPNPAKPDLRDTGTLRLSVAIPLDSVIPNTKTNLDFFTTHKKIERQKLQLEKVINDAMYDIKKTVYVINRYETIISNLQLNLQIAQRSYDLSTAAYQNGTIPYLDVADAKNSLDMAFQRIQSERYNYRTQLLDLEFALNTQLE